MNATEEISSLQKERILEIKVFLENKKETLEKKLEQKILKVIMSIRKIEISESRAKAETGHFLWNPMFIKLSIKCEGRIKIFLKAGSQKNCLWWSLEIYKEISAKQTKV